MATNSTLCSRVDKQYIEKVTISDETEVTVTKGQLRILLAGLCAWNCPAIDLLSERGQKKIHDAQDLIERIWQRYR